MALANATATAAAAAAAAVENSKAVRAALAGTSKQEQHASYRQEGIEDDFTDFPSDMVEETVQILQATTANNHPSNSPETPHANVSSPATTLTALEIDNEVEHLPRGLSSPGRSLRTATSPALEVDNVVEHLPGGLSSPGRSLRTATSPAAPVEAAAEALQELNGGFAAPVTRQKESEGERGQDKIAVPRLPQPCIKGNSFEIVIKYLNKHGVARIRQWLDQKYANAEDQEGHLCVTGPGNARIAVQTKCLGCSKFHVTEKTLIKWESIIIAYSNNNTYLIRELLDGDNVNQEMQGAYAIHHAYKIRVITKSSTQRVGTLVGENETCVGSLEAR
ncbi:MAG: hypothetical protein Q9225_000859 [Loekoesia sp. 1 TL-2023]